MNELTPKERMAIPRQAMPAQDPTARSANFEEVNFGFTEEQAIEEAKRCLECKKQNCVEGCPVNVNIPGFIQKIVDGEYLEAATIIKGDNILPAVCARVCPQEEQCEGHCVLAKRGNAVAIGPLARFVIDYDTKHGEKQVMQITNKTGKKVAIIGSGPAGLSCAGDLIKAGHEVTIFEALHEPGGVLSYGIPEFRLPKAIVKREVAQLTEMGVQIRKNTVIGVTITIDELFADGYDAVFVGVGAGLPYFLNIPGEEMIGVYSANEFLTRVNLMKAYRFPNFDTPVFDCKDRNVAVIGGGNTAMDSVRTAIRLGAKNAYILYRRTEAELPARIEEVHHAKEEGVQFKFLNSPVEFIGDKLGWLKAVRLQEMELGEPDASGRRRPIPIEGKQTVLDIDMAVVAIGNGSNPIIQRTTPNLDFNKWGNIQVDPESMQTSMPGVYAGGDIVTGGATVILAMGAGRKAAKAINEYLA